MTLVPRVVELLHAQHIDDVLVTVGGTIPADDIQPLKQLGVAEVFTPGATTQSIIEFIRGAASSPRGRIGADLPGGSRISPRGGKTATKQS